MYINKVIIKKFRHLENEVIGPLNFNHKHSDLTVFAGPNGSGKSSVLELLGYALSSSYSLGWALSRTFHGFSFEIAIGLSNEERKIVIDSLKFKLNEVAEKIANGIIEIDAKADIKPEVKEAQKQQLTEQLKRPHRHHFAILEYLDKSSIYYRAFDYNEGEYAKNANLQNQIHDYVTEELKNKLQRSLGFFLRSDRHYPQKGFDRNRIFSFDQVLRKEHLWSMAFNTSEIQYQDMYDFLVQQRYHYLRELGNFHNRKNKNLEVGTEPSDPIQPYEELLSKLFPDYKFADLNESVPSNLFIELPSKEVITFNDLSSGEKEVFFILSFFIRHNVENAVIVIDEPELHLHPELARLLIRNLKSIRTGNQIWIATHNSEIVDEAGRDKVIYVSRDLATRKAKFITGEKEQEVITQLKNLFGFSGYIGIAKNLVFLEGDNSSPDRKFYSSLFPGDNSHFKLVPSSSSDNLARLNGAILSIMDANLGWMNFFLIRDRDYLTPEMVQKYRGHSSGKVFVLAKHEIENYLINFEIISTVLKDIFDIIKTPTQLKETLFNEAIAMSAGIIRDMIAFRLNLKLNPQDFSIGKVFNGEAYFERSESSCQVKADKSTLLKQKFTKVSTEINLTLNNALSQHQIENTVQSCEMEVKAALESDGWLNLFPGKELLEQLSKKLGISNSVSLQNSIIKEFASHRENIDSELVEIFKKINES